MARTSYADVTARIDTDLSQPQVESFIDDANAWVTDFLASEDVSSARLTQIELYLSCHYVTLRDPRLRQQQVEDVRETLQRDTQVTEYLRQAIAEDPTGIVRGHFLQQETAAAVNWSVGVYDPGTP